MTKQQYINDRLKVLYTATEIHSPAGVILIDDELRVELCQRLSNYVKKEAKVMYEKKFPAGKDQLDMLEIPPVVKPKK